MVKLDLLATAVCLFYWLTNQLIYKIHFKDEKKEQAAARPVYKTSGATRLFKPAVRFLYGLVLVRIIATPFLTIPIERTNLILGSILCAIGIILLNKSLRTLGNNYAPCHAGVIPHERIKAGPYRVFAHPIYLANLILLAGVWIAIGGFLLGPIWLSFAFFYAVSIRDEEKAFKEHF
ncbi:MAG: hypothetical protein HOI23_14725 [Deltaproteobacteria bacterium]|jgi:protein-S-isoprenylcysteine O-methyltransferase Ste14|nr:hypothetical protein [Deltaproteobacteria bacterium]MBT6434760.1 hypothetical protein [Deltaproteobacteria bacterium]MBT6490569.1 hypothetical protein [Deltaproteobacteria bacterium]